MTISLSAINTTQPINNVSIVSNNTTLINDTPLTAKSPMPVDMKHDNIVLDQGSVDLLRQMKRYIDGKK